MRVTNGVAAAILASRGVIYDLFEGCAAHHEFVHAAAVRLLEETVHHVLAFYVAIDASRTRHSQWINDLKALHLSAIVTFQFIVKCVVASSCKSCSSQYASEMRQLMCAFMLAIHELMYTIYITEESSVIPELLVSISEKCIDVTLPSANIHDFCLDESFYSEFLDDLFITNENTASASHQSGYNYSIELYLARLIESLEPLKSRMIEGNGSAPLSGGSSHSHTFDSSFLSNMNLSLHSKMVELLRDHQTERCMNGITNNTDGVDTSGLKSVLSSLCTAYLEAVASLPISCFDAATEFSLWGYVIQAADCAGYVDKLSVTQLSLESIKRQFFDEMKSNNGFTRMLNWLDEDKTLLIKNYHLQLNQDMKSISHLMSYYCRRPLESHHLLSTFLCNNEYLKLCVQHHSSLTSASNLKLSSSYVSISRHKLKGLLYKRRELLPNASNYPPYSEVEQFLKTEFLNIIEKLK